MNEKQARTPEGQIYFIKIPVYVYTFVFITKNIVKPTFKMHVSTIFWLQFFYFFNLILAIYNTYFFFIINTSIQSYWNSLYILKK